MFLRQKRPSIQKMTSKFYKAVSLVPAFLAPVMALFFSCSLRVPVISSIDPKTGNIGEVITLRGSNFGEDRDESYVSIAGTTPTNSSYYRWQDDLISIKVPESGESGLIYVHVRGRKSNGVLFLNSAAVPKPVDGENFGLEPKISSVSPQMGPPGTIITITGSNFGASRETGGVFFSWDFESTSFNPYEVREPEFIEVSETELGYEAWNAREIRVRLPDGAVSGNLEVRTSHGKSRPVFFDVSGRPGTKTFSEKRSYTINFSVDVKILEAARPNTLYLWVPRPVSSPSQRNVNLISCSANPFVDNYRGASLFKLENLGTGTSHTISCSFSIDVYALETEIRPQAVRQEESPLFAIYTQSSALIPSDDPQIKAAVNTIIGREQNPYNKAKLIYDWILANIEIFETLPVPSGGIAAALEKRQLDSYHAALLFTAMARAARLPCIPAAGVLVNRSGQTLQHYWAEFWIDGFGWLPVDPAMGYGAVPENFISKQNLAGYYFGNLDSQRIAFSRGEVKFSQMDSRGRVVSHTHSYSLQNIWEEAAGGLESYSSLWGDITISGIYVQ